ncbi:MAG: 16S rRNA (cytosine(967)-C(5))-methyltransferase RsmB, partial [Acidobacteria bacterium]|nr:16S rRNA (cytosine(967)-C(5))-methyltransferase RsmB [Acidobacteriota bacterium]
SILLPLYEKNLGNKDAALCHELTLGVLRNRFLLDRQIEMFSNRKLSKFDMEVLTALRIGLYQICFLDKIPNYSAINESV